MKPPIFSDAIDKSKDNSLFSLQVLVHSFYSIIIEKNVATKQELNNLIETTRLDLINEINNKPKYKNAKDKAGKLSVKNKNLK